MMSSARFWFRAGLAALLLAGLTTVWLRQGRSPDRAGRPTTEALRQAAPVLVEPGALSRGQASALALSEWATRAAVAKEQAPALQEALTEEGLRLAEERRAWMQSLIEQDPEEAIRNALSYTERMALPPEVRARIEQPVSGSGTLAVIGTTPAPDAEPGQPGVFRTVFLNDREYRAFVYGRRLDQATLQQASLHGIALGDAMAVHESPLRRVAADEAAALVAAGKGVAEPCPVSAVPVTPAEAEAVVELHGNARFLCSGGHVQDLEGTAMAAEGDGGGFTPAAASVTNAWSQGSKTLLYIRIRFLDQTNEPQTFTDLSNMMVTVNQFFRDNSYHSTDITTTITPTFQLPYDTAYYNSNGIYTLRTHALNAAKTNGYDYVNWNLDAVRYVGGPGAFGGAAYVGSRGCWMKSSSAGVAAHEFGHNYGMWHANSWNPTDESPIGPGTWSEYGDSFDTMGAASAGNNHFNARYKAAINWIPPEGYQVVTNSGLYQVYAHDNTNSTDLIRGLRVVRTSTTNYSVEFRQKFTSNAGLMNGAGIRRTATANNNNPGSELLDLTPGSPDGKTDAALVIGRTFSDRLAGIHITPLRKLGTSPESLEVDVRFGQFPGNAAPTVALSASSTTVAAGATVTLTASSADADGDSLSYYWDLGDKTYGANAASVTKSWSVAGDYLVQCEVSDRRGGKTLRWIVVTVGSPTTFRISGRVLDTNGAPLQGVRVHNGKTTTSYRGCYTDADGQYTVVGLASGSYTMAAAAYGYTVASSGFINPVTVSPSRTGIDFVASPRTYQISGRVTEGGFPVAGVRVGDGVRSALTDTNGDFVVTGFGNGTYTFTATKTGGTFNPSGWSNPITIQDGNVTGRNFAAPTFTITGEITGVPLTNVVVITDGYRSVNSARTGSGTSAKNTFTLSGVPAGRWNLRAFYPGLSFTPSGFSNPLVLSGSTSAKNFAADSTTTYSIAGSIVENGSGLAGVTVAAGVQASTTDSRGGFFLQGLANGTYTVTPQLAGYSFTPASATVTINGNNVSGSQFVANRIVAPTVTVTATPASISESGGLAAGTFTLTRSGLPATNELTVQFTVAGTATSGSDYEALPSSVTFPVGETTTQVAVTPVNDTAVECSETLLLTLSPSAGVYDLGSPSSATLTLTDDDLPSVTLSVTDAEAAEAGLNPGQFRVTRTGCLSAPLTVIYTVEGTATGGTDYTSLPGSVTLPAGAASATVTVTPADDSEAEPAETVLVTLLVGTGYVVESTQQGTVTLADNDTNLAPIANAGSDQSVSVLGLATLSGSATDDGLPLGAAMSVSWSKVSGPGTVLFDDPSATTATACFSAPGAYTLRLTASDGPLSGSDDVVVTVTEVDPAKVVNALNAGGAAHTGAGGLPYRDDGWNTGGETAANAATPIAATLDEALYQSAREGVSFSLAIPLPGGAQSYLVALKFAEFSATAPGQRLIDVAVDGQAFLQGFDPLAAAGALATAVDVVFPVTASGDRLTLAFSAGTGATLPASVCAVVVGSSAAIAIPAPADLTATSTTGTQVDLAWTDRSSGETAFSVERSVNGGAFAVLATTPANATTYSDLTTVSGTPYAYRIRAIAVNGSAYGNTASLTTPGAPPAPSTLTATAISTSQINLAWRDNASTETSHVVERSTDNVNFTTVANLGANATTWSDTGLASGLTYYYRVRACNADGCSAPSATASATTLATTPAAPSGLTATAQTGLRISLSWADNASNEANFSIERSTRATSGFKAIATVGANVTAFTDGIGLSSGKIYYYRVRAINSAGNSAYSNTASATARR
ncbi:MAG: hypothetical protein RJA22_2687 [Verrucomicrobiota bacterium]